eukprot:6288386-Prymnesium_polylepis.1
MRPPGVAGENVTQGAVIDHVRPSAVSLYDFTSSVEIAALSLYLLEAAGLPLDHGLRPRLPALELCAVGDCTAQLTCALSYVGSWLAQHASHLAGG